MRLIGADIDGGNTKVGRESTGGRTGPCGRPNLDGPALPALILADDRGGGRFRVARDAVVHA
ncbi:TPA: hypothetical protein ACT5CG_004318, partial [Burkholderia cenocepacia]